jgi:hypothetical protein
MGNVLYVSLDWEDNVALTVYVSCRLADNIQ